VSLDVPDGVISRHQVQGGWYERELAFDASLMKEGENVLTLMVPAGSLNSGVIYDYIRLELEGAPTAQSDVSDPSEELPTDPSDVSDPPEESPTVQSDDSPEELPTVQSDASDVPEELSTIQSDVSVQAGSGGCFINAVS